MFDTVVLLVPREMGICLEPVHEAREKAKIEGGWIGEELSTGINDEKMACVS
jgi:hypothetical protein